MTLAGAALALVLGACGAASAGLIAPGRYRVSFEHLGGAPFGVVVTRDGRYAFVDLLPGQVLVYRIHGFSPPRLIRSIPVPGEAAGSSLTRDGRLLLVANGQGATVVSVARAERGGSHPVLGTLRPPGPTDQPASGAIETASSADGRFVFVSLESSPAGGAIAVYRIGSTASPRLDPADYIGSIPLGLAVVGSAVSPDGSFLYVTSEFGRPSAVRTMFGGATLAQRIKAGSRRGFPEGTVSVIDVATAERDPTHAVLANVPALQQPVRVAASPDGSVIWVTARASNRLLAFSSAGLRTDPHHALIASIRVGAAPVGVAVSTNGQRVIVADSDRYDSPGAHPAITVIDARAALAHRPATVARLPAGRFPREIAVALSGVALISNFASDQLETLELTRAR